MAQVDLQTRWVSGHQNIHPVKVDASTAAIAKYDPLGKDASGFYTLWTSGSVHGIAEEGLTVAPAADGGTVISAHLGDSDALYDFPILTGTLTQAMEGKTCDFTVSSGRFGLDVTASTYDNAIIFVADVVNQRALVKLAPPHAGVV
jgi:hypothetical protein